MVSFSPMTISCRTRRISQRKSSTLKSYQYLVLKGASLCGKVTLIKSLLIPKIIYTSSLLPTPEHIVKDLNHILYTFLWKGKDNVTRASTINNYEEGGIKMVDIESLIKPLRLSWLKRIFSDNSGAWKNYLEYILKDSGGLTHCQGLKSHIIYVFMER